MADSKKYDGSQWEHSLRKLTTATEAIENPLYSDGTAITSYTLKGNVAQSGTPTPSNPVDVNGVGERTANVMPAGELKTVESNGVTFSSDGKGKYTINGTATADASTRFNLLSAFTTPISVSNGGQGTLSFFNTSANNKVIFYFCNGTTMVDDWRQKSIRRTTTEYNVIGKKYVDSVVIAVESGATVDITITPEFTNDGVLPKTFEKFGYKIPISSGGVTTNIYLGSTQTVRQIKKLVLTGDESSWRTTGSGAYALALTSTEMCQTSCYCTHYIGTISGSVVDGECTVNTSTDEMVVRDNNVTNLTSYKQWLAAQYVNGTPVILYYVLATPETAAVNEPLMKIGDYADTLSNATAIPTTEGANSISVDTTVQPSEFTATWTGWHNASVKEWDGSDWQ